CSYCSARSPSPSARRSPWTPISTWPARPWLAGGLDTGTDCCPMSRAVPKPLVIVESPAKARTIAGFLGNDFVVESSVGHIRDLPRNAADVPASVKGESWARLGVDVNNGF